MHDLGSGRWLALLVTVAVLAALVDGLLLLVGQDDSSVAEAREAAVASAEARVPAMLSYGYRTLDGDLAVARGNATGAFAPKYAAALTERAAPNATRKKLTTRAKVTDAAFLSGDERHASVLVMLTQSTTTGHSRKPTVDRSELRVELRRTRLGWFVSDIIPL